MRPCHSVGPSFMGPAHEVSTCESCNAQHQDSQDSQDKQDDQDA